MKRYAPKLLCMFLVWMRGHFGPNAWRWKAQCSGVHDNVSGPCFKRFPRPGTCSCKLTKTATGDPQILQVSGQGRP